MKLPLAESAIVSITKLRDYCLSPEHPRGKNKARLFRSALGLSLEDAMEFQAILKRAAAEGEAVQGMTDLHGTRYIVDFSLTWRGKTASVRSCWIVAQDGKSPRLLTSWVIGRE